MLMQQQSVKTERTRTGR